MSTKAQGLLHHSKKGGNMDKALKSYQEKLTAFFKSTRKTSWGKSELISQLQDLYIEHLEDTIRNNSEQ